MQTQLNKSTREITVEDEINSNDDPPTTSSTPTTAYTNTVTNADTDFDNGVVRIATPSKRPILKRENAEIYNERKHSMNEQTSMLLYKTIKTELISMQVSMKSLELKVEMMIDMLPIQRKIYPSNDDDDDLRRSRVDVKYLKTK